MPRESRLFFKELGDRIQDCQYVCQQSAEIVAIPGVIVASTMEEAVPESPLAEQCLDDETQVSGTLAEPAHEIREPFAAERNVHAHRVAAGSQ
jgi:hypothetical protein